MRTIAVSLSLLVAAASCATDAGRAKSAGAQSAGAVKIVDISAAGSARQVELSIKASGPIHSTVFTMRDPAALVVDLTGVDLSSFGAAIPVGSEPVTDITPIYFASSKDARLQVGLTGEVDYLLDTADPKELKILIAPKGSGLVAQEVSAPAPEAAHPAPMSGATVEALVSGQSRVEDVSFMHKGSLSRVTVTMSRESPAYRLIPRDELKRLTLDLPGALVTADSEKLVNVDAEGSRVKNVAVFQFASGADPVAKVVVNLTEKALYNVRAEGRSIILDVGDEAVLAQAREVKEAELAQAAPERKTLTPSEKVYTGAKVSLDFQKADIHNILRIIADVSGLNVITSDKVKGDVTIKLANVPWEQALEVILKNNNLDMIREGNIIRIAPAAEIGKEKKAMEELMETEAKIAPLYTRIFEVSYETASNMKTNLESIKSERGSVEINSRTNTLIVKDTKEKLAEMAALIEALDRKETQVLIEARIVETTHSTARELGIQWGGHFNTVTGQNFPYTVGVTGAAGPSPNIGVGGSAVNTGIESAAAGALGITLGHVAGTALLDARLLALENNGNGRIISMPKITTMNNKEALIESGREIPYQTTSSDGTKTEFKSATLSLKVTPHVTPDEHVRMNISVNKDEADFANRLAGGAPPILTKKATTEVLVRDGATTVIGGLFKDTDTGSNRQVPGIGDVPVLGWLFKNKINSKSGEELLIFITPKIVE
ncbi:MAG: type IV pilus secretin PilQ [Nitrospinae bacterium]|nr:type IV pilus secretin PilQ [Nitrospinota bacterium]